MNKYVVIVYKEVGKNPEFRKILNDITEFKRLVDGEFNTVKYDSFYIVYNKDSKNLKANIYLNTFKLNELDKTIRGNIFAINFNEKLNEFISLNKSQAFKCRKLFIRESYTYSNYNMSKERQNNEHNKQNLFLVQNKNYFDNLSTKSNYKAIRNNFERDENEKLERNYLEADNLKEMNIKDSNLILNSKFKNDINDVSNLSNEKAIRLILAIQMVILKWIRKNSK